MEGDAAKGTSVFWPQKQVPPPSLPQLCHPHLLPASALSPPSPCLGELPGPQPLARSPTGQRMRGYVSVSAAVAVGKRQSVRGGFDPRKLVPLAGGTAGASGIGLVRGS